MKGCEDSTSLRGGRRPRPLTVGRQRAPCSQPFGRISGGRRASAVADVSAGNRTIARLYRFSVTFGLLALILGLNGPLGIAHDSSLLRLATTTSVHNSGLMQQIVDSFESDSGYRIEVHALGSGAALHMGREGLADVIISNSPEAENQFMQEGSGAVRQPVMHNDFVLVGPADDPAEIRGLSYCVAALKRIAAGRHTFASRADQSGTHQRELELWLPTGLEPYGENWYRETGMGMGDTLRLANEMQAYVLVDRGTWLAMRSTLTLTLLCDGDPRLVNNYNVIAVSGDSHPEVNERAGRAFVDWITSDRIQALIGGFMVDGEVLFVPAKGRP